MKCRFCNNKLKHIFIDLGKSPLANSYLNNTEINKMEPFYPLRTYVCTKCFLVQLEEFEKSTKIFSNYAYFSSYSQTWLNHVRDFVNNTIERFKISNTNLVIEIASNDGYLLEYFKKQNIPVLGIEPAANVAKVAKKKKIPTISKFFGQKIAKELVRNGKKADVLIAFNVLPHVPNLTDFVKGLKKLLNNKGILIIQFSAYLLTLIQKVEFDTIYHEHFSYFSLFTLQKIFSAYNLEIFDVEELNIHGGSMRLYLKHLENKDIIISNSVIQKLKQEKKFGLTSISTYTTFSNKVNISKRKIWQFFIDAKRKRKTIVGYGAPAKGNTLLNYCGIGHDFIDYTVDLNPHKQNLFLPGTHIPILKPTMISKTKPDYVVILAWNFKEEVMEQTKIIKKWGGKFVVLIPTVKVL